MSDTKKQPGRWSRLKSWQQLVLVALVGALLLGGVGWWSQSMVTVGSGGDEAGARDVCETFVERRLKAPSTAEFGDATTSQDGDQWTVQGDVDAENSFGAPIRTSYVCTVTPADANGTNWDLVDIQISE